MTDNELPEVVTEALAPTTFNVLDFVQGIAGPLDTVAIYTDNNAGYKLAKLREREAALAKKDSDLVGIADEQDWIDADEIDALEAKVADSALIFQLQGLAPALKKAIRAEKIAKYGYKEGESAEDNEDFFEALTYELVAKTVKSVTKGNAIDAHTWTAEEVAQFRTTINESEFKKLDDAVFGINYQTDIFDRAVSADFLSKR